jgi:hypothetical protein
VVLAVHQAGVVAAAGRPSMVAEQLLGPVEMAVLG